MVMTGKCDIYRAVSLCTDVSFKGGVCQESFSFDGSSERDFAEFLDFVHDGEACLKPTNSVSRPQALVQQSGLGSEKKGAASPPGSPRGLLRSNCSSHSMVIIIYTYVSRHHSYRILSSIVAVFL